MPDFKAELCPNAEACAGLCDQQQGTVIKRVEVSTPFAEAATRMFRDAVTLHNAGRLGTPDHLFGLACECALKAVLCGHGFIAGTHPPKPFKVHIDDLWDEYQSALQGRITPLGPNPFNGWRVHDRYSDDALFTSQRVAVHRSGALQGMSALEAATSQGFVS